MLILIRGATTLGRGSPAWFRLPGAAAGYLLFKLLAPVSRMPTIPVCVIRVPCTMASRLKWVRQCMSPGPPNIWLRRGPCRRPQRNFGAVICNTSASTCHICTICVWQLHRPPLLFLTRKRCHILPQGVAATSKNKNTSFGVTDEGTAWWFVFFFFLHF